MNIGTIKQLDVGTSNIACRGVIKYLGEPKHITGTKDGRDYDFWRQFVVLEEGKDSIGVNLALESKVALSKNQTIQVEKGTLESYPKDGETKLSLKAKLYSVGNTQQSLPQPPQATNPGQGQSDSPNWDKIAEGKTRSLIVANAIGSGQLKCSSIQDVNNWLQFCLTGQEPTAPVDDYPVDEPPQEDLDIPFDQQYDLDG